MKCLFPQHSIRLVARTCCFFWRLPQQCAGLLCLLTPSPPALSLSLGFTSDEFFNASSPELAPSMASESLPPARSALRATLADVPECNLATRASINVAIRGEGGEVLSSTARWGPTSPHHAPPRPLASPPQPESEHEHDLVISAKAPTPRNALGVQNNFGAPPAVGTRPADGCNSPETKSFPPRDDLCSKKQPSRPFPFKTRPLPSGACAGYWYWACSLSLTVL